MEKTRFLTTHTHSTAAQPSALWQEGVITHLLPVLCSEALYNDVFQSALLRDPQKSADLHIKSSLSAVCMPYAVI